MAVASLDSNGSSMAYPAEGLMRTGWRSGAI